MTTKSENGLEYLDVPEFGFLPFDLYVMAKWDTSSPLSTLQQKKQLVEDWVKLGSYGRREYLGTIPTPEEIPSTVPQDLLSPRERAHNGQIGSTLFIRTWYGDPSDSASQEKADADYAHLVDVASSPYGGGKIGMGLMMGEFFVFDDKEEFSSSVFFSPSQSQSKNVDVDVEVEIEVENEFSNGVAIPKPGCMPPYVLAALMHCPDQIDEIRIETADLDLEDPRDDSTSVEEYDRQQRLLVLVADREACEEGWVLHLAINHKGQVLPFRIRDGADWVSTSHGNWSDGQQLTENTLDPEEDVELYMDRGGGGGGWD